MPRRSAVELLPPELKAWLDAELIKRGFSDYVELANDLNIKGGGDVISKSSLHRYGQNFEERLQALKFSTEQAKALIDASPDNEDAMNQALVRLTQEKIFSILLELKVDPSKVNLSGLTRSIAELARASITVKDYAAKVKAKALDAATAVAATAKKAGLSDDAVEQIKRRILGITE